MNIEERVRILENKVAQLSEAFLNAQRQNVPVVSKVDDTANKVVEITPYTSSKPAFYGEKEITFYDAPMGIVSVYIDNYKKDYSVSRIDNRLIITLEEAIEVPQTLVTITIQ